METVDALGIDVCFRSYPSPVRSVVDDDGGDDHILEFDILKLQVREEDSIDLAEVADGCADIKVVTTGTLSACGIADVSIQEEVDANNLAKFGPGHSWNEVGKLIKPANHKGPELGRVLDEQVDEVLSHQSAHKSVGL